MGLTPLLHRPRTCAIRRRGAASDIDAELDITLLSTGDALGVRLILSDTANERCAGAASDMGGEAAVLVSWLIRPRSSVWREFRYFNFVIS